MIVLQVNYLFRNMTRAQWEQRYTDEMAEKFLSVDGLVWKIWLDSPDENRVGGLYLFETRAQADAYLAGPIVARMRANPDVTELETRVFNVRDRMSAITHAPVPGLAQPSREAAE
jgi:hypothetical protein